jgi:hypothetical protein
MKRYLWLSVMLMGLLALAACGARPTVVSTATPAPLATDVPATNTLPAPTATVPAPTEPAPTATSEPTTEPTHEPTTEPAVTPATPVPATPDPNQGVGAVAYEDRLNGLDGWGWNFSDDAVSFTQAGDELQAVMHDPNAWWRFTLGPDDLALDDQQVMVTAHTVACGAQDEYALMFRAAPLAGAPEGQYQAYVFKLNCSGAARLDRLEGTRQTALVDWTVSDAIRSGAPATNELMVWMAGPEFRFYVNGQYLFSAQDAGFANGTFGFYVDDQTAGGLTVNFEDLTARTVAAVSGS